LLLSQFTGDAVAQPWRSLPFEHAGKLLALPGERPLALGLLC
jgi:hypothetical protein